MKLVISSDYAGFPLKEDVRANLAAEGHEVVDLGTYKVQPEDDYPDFAEKVGEAIKAGVAPRGILICGSGVGVCVAGNKIPGISPNELTAVGGTSATPSQEFHRFAIAGDARLVVTLPSVGDLAFRALHDHAGLAKQVATLD